MPHVFLPQILWHSKDNKRSDRIYSIDIQPYPNYYSVQKLERKWEAFKEYLHVKKLQNNDTDKTKKLIHNEEEKNINKEFTDMTEPSQDTQGTQLTHVENEKEKNDGHPTDGKYKSDGKEVQTKQGDISRSIKFVLVTCGADEFVHLWRIYIKKDLTIKCISRFIGHNGEINCVRFNKNGRYIATGGEDKFVYIWEKGKKPQSTPLGYDASFLDYKEWWHRVGSFRCSGVINSIVWSNSDTLFIANEDNNINIIDFVKNTNCKVKILEGHTGMIQGITIDCSNEYLASLSSDQTLKIWKKKNDGKTWKLENSIKNIKKEELEKYETGGSTDEEVKEKEKDELKEFVYDEKMDKGGSEENEEEEGEGEGQEGEKKLKRCLYSSEEMLPSFFRRIDFSPNGEFLVTPSGLQFEQVERTEKEEKVKEDKREKEGNVEKKENVEKIENVENVEKIKNVETVETVETVENVEEREGGKIEENKELNGSERKNGEQQDREPQNGEQHDIQINDQNKEQKSKEQKVEQTKPSYQIKAHSCFYIYHKNLFVKYSIPFFTVFSQTSQFLVSKFNCNTFKLRTQSKILKRCYSSLLNRNFTVEDLLNIHKKPRIFDDAMHNDLLQSTKHLIKLKYEKTLLYHDLESAETKSQTISSTITDSDLEFASEEDKKKEAKETKKEIEEEKKGETKEESKKKKEVYIKQEAEKSTEMKETKEAEESTDMKEKKEAEKSTDMKEKKEAEESTDMKEKKEAEESTDMKETKEVEESTEMKEKKEVEETAEAKDTKDTKETTEAKVEKKEDSGDEADVSEDGEDDESEDEADEQKEKDNQEKEEEEAEEKRETEEKEKKEERFIYTLGTFDGTVYFYDSEILDTPISIIKNIHLCPITDIAWSNSGNICACSSSDGYVSFYYFNKEELGKVKTYNNEYFQKKCGDLTFDNNYFENIFYDEIEFFNKTAGVNTDEGEYTSSEDAYDEEELQVAKEEPKVKRFNLVFGNAAKIVLEKNTKK